MKLTGKRCQCAACGRYFKSLGVFDKHRIGEHGIDRRCATDDELKARGLELSDRGFWVTRLHESKRLQHWA